MRMLISRGWPPCAGGHLWLQCHADDGEDGLQSRYGPLGISETYKVSPRLGEGEPGPYWLTHLLRGP